MPESSGHQGLGSDFQRPASQPPTSTGQAPLPKSPPVYYNIQPSCPASPFSDPMSPFCPINPSRWSSHAELLSSQDSSCSINLIPSCQLPCLKCWPFRGRCIPITPAQENLRVAVIPFLIVSSDVTMLPWLLKVIGKVEFFPNYPTVAFHIKAHSCVSIGLLQSSRRNKKSQS